MNRATLTAGGALAFLALVPVVAYLLDEPFYVDVFLRVMIFAIAAISLDFILGYGGMISFGHAVYLGVGAYSVAILSFYGVDNGYVHFVVAITASALCAWLIGFISLRTTGVYFIMITLAFAQMVYFLGISVNTYGGDDGINVARRSDFGFFTLNDNIVLYYFILASLALVIFFGLIFIRSKFGRVLVGIRINERRMVALGFSTFSYRVVAFVLAGAVCGFAGALLVNQTLFISPGIMHWTRSGEIMVMVIVGGVGTIVGPVLGTAAYMLLEHTLSGWTIHWQLALGLILVGLVLFFRKGILGLVLRKSG